MKGYLKEYFGDIHIQMMSGLFIIGLVSIVNGMDRWSTWLAFVIGLVTYTVAEYFNHRFLFHMETPKNPWMLKFIKRIHFDHHVDPRDLKLLFLPVWYSLPQIIVASLIVFAIFGNITLAVAYADGIIAMLLYYEWTHYVAHQPIIPKTPWGKKVE
jgi:uncharacterized membrane-anchored protein